MAIALATTRSNKSLRLDRPLVRSSLELSAIGLLALAGAGVWLFLIPVELLGFFAA